MLNLLEPPRPGVYVMDLSALRWVSDNFTAFWSMDMGLRLHVFLSHRWEDYIYRHIFLLERTKTVTEKLQLFKLWMEHHSEFVLEQRSYLIPLYESIIGHSLSYCEVELVSELSQLHGIIRTIPICQEVTYHLGPNTLLSRSPLCYKGITWTPKSVAFSPK